MSIPTAPALSPDEAIAWETLDELCTSMLGSHVLAKACCDKPFDYALKLRTGETIRFSGATIIRPGWIHLDVLPPNKQAGTQRLPYLADRGVEVRVEEIIWAMDAPQGS